MNINEKYTLADLVIEHAIKGGADNASVIIQDSRSTNIEIRDQKIDSLKESNRLNLGISLYVDKKFSSHSTNRMNKEELFKFVDEAIIATRYLSEDDFRTLPDPELFYKGGGSDLNIFDPKLENVDTKTKINLANNTLKEAYKKDERIISVSSYYYDNVSNSVIVTSNGFKGDSRSSNISLGASVSVKSDSGRPSDFWNENALFFDKLKTNDIGKKALERTLNKIGPKKIASGKYTILLENRVAGNLLNPIFQALQGSNLHMKQSFLIGKIGKPVASALITINDDPLITSGFGSRHFDEEGLAASKRAVIENGVLKSYFIDNYYGKKLGMKPTSGSTSNIVFDKGNRSQQEILATINKGVFITGFIGGNCNGSTGDFSYGIEGYLIQNGKLSHPINEMNIAGNMNQFWFNVNEIGNDAVENQSIMTPSILLENVDLSGL